MINHCCQWDLKYTISRIWKVLLLAWSIFGLRLCQRVIKTRMPQYNKIFLSRSWIHSYLVQLYHLCYKINLSVCMYVCLYVPKYLEKYRNFSIKINIAIVEALLIYYTCISHTYLTTKQCVVCCSITSQQSHVTKVCGLNLRHHEWFTVDNKVWCTGIT